MAHESELTTLFGPEPSLKTLDPGPSAVPSVVALRFFGVLLILSGTFFLLLSGYLVFAQYWLQTQWIKTDAKVLSRQDYDQRSVQAARLSRGATIFYGVRCSVSFPANGEIRHSQLDFGPAFPSKLDAQIWAGHCQPGQQIPVLYKPSDPARIRFAGDYPSSYATAAGTLKLAAWLLVPGLLAIMAARSDLFASAKSALHV